MRIVLLGANGQVGWELQRSLAPLGALVAVQRSGPDGHCADLLEPAAIAGTVEALAPDVIVNAAAYTAVDAAESDPARAHTVNAESPAALASVAARTGAWLVQYSTDYVFDGSGQAAWNETSPTAPLNVYGHSKLAGEDAIRASGCRHLIFRTSWVFSARGGNFAKTMLRLASERGRLTVIDDQVGAPTGADLLADVTAHALRAAMRHAALGGTYHVAAAGTTTWYGYARLVVDWARAKGQPLRLAEGALVPIATADYPTPARRPLNSRLDCRHLESTFDLRLPNWQQGVERMLEEVLTR